MTKCEKGRVTMTFTEPIRKYILSGLVAFVVIGLIVANVMASKQDDKFKINEASYTQAIQLQSTGDIVGSAEAIKKSSEKRAQFRDGKLCSSFNFCTKRRYEAVSNSYAKKR